MKGRGGVNLVKKKKNLKKKKKKLHWIEEDKIGGKKKKFTKNKIWGWNCRGSMYKTLTLFHVVHHECQREDGDPCKDPFITYPIHEWVGSSAAKRNRENQQ